MKTLSLGFLLVMGAQSSAWPYALDGGSGGSYGGGSYSSGDQTSLGDIIGAVAEGFINAFEPAGANWTLRKHHAPQRAMERSEVAGDSLRTLSAQCGVLPWQRKDFASIVTAKDVDECLHNLKELTDWSKAWSSAMKFQLSGKELKVYPWELYLEQAVLTSRTGYQLRYDDGRSLLSADKEGRTLALSGENSTDTFAFLREFVDAAEISAAQQRASRKKALSGMDLSSLTPEQIDAMKTRMAEEDKAAGDNEMKIQQLRAFVAAAKRVLAKLALEAQRYQAKFSQELNQRLHADTSDKRLLDLLGRRFGDGTIKSEKDLEREIQAALELAPSN